MRFFMSGPSIKNELQFAKLAGCTCRLFSLHGNYKRDAFDWVRACRSASYYPRNIMLDSGAFTAWNAGKETSLSEVVSSYREFMQLAHNLFDEVWMVNLDKIPGSPGVTPSADAVAAAIRESDSNFKKLTEIFGNRILPVYHQGETFDRLHEVAAMANYICVSPRNDLHEALRRTWAAEVHLQIPGKRTHGLATTGNEMMLDVPWYSIDSAAWRYNAMYGMLYICVDGQFGSQMHKLFVSNNSSYTRVKNKHLDTCNPAIRNVLESAAERYGFAIDDVCNSFEARAAVSMGELLRYNAWATERQAEGMKTTQTTLFGEM